jgi:hypothetical protein
MDEKPYKMPELNLDDYMDAEGIHAFVKAIQEARQGTEIGPLPGFIPIMDGDKLVCYFFADADSILNKPNWEKFLPKRNIDSDWKPSREES